MWQKKKIESFIKRNYKTCPVFNKDANTVIKILKNKNKQKV